MRQRKTKVFEELMNTSSVEWGEKTATLRVYREKKHFHSRQQSMKRILNSGIAMHKRLSNGSKEDITINMNLTKVLGSF